MWLTSCEASAQNEMSAGIEGDLLKLVNTESGAVVHSTNQFLTSACSIKPLADQAPQFYCGSMEWLGATTLCFVASPRSH